MPEITRTELKTLKDFYALMAATRQVRFTTVKTIMDGGEVSGHVILSLKNALASLEDVPEQEGKRVLFLDGERTIDLEMDYEINETRKDLFYLEEGEETFLDFLSELHPGFDDHVRAGHELLSDRKSVV